MCRYIITSLCKKDCRRDKRLSEYISLYIGELGGVLWNVGQVSGEIQILFEDTEAFFKILAASKEYNEDEYRRVVNELLFRDAEYYNSLNLPRELPGSLMELFQRAIYNNRLIYIDEEHHIKDMRNAHNSFKSQLTYLIVI